MKSWITSLFLVVFPLFCLSQKRSYWYDSLVPGYNYLEGKAFSNLELEDTSGRIFSTSSLAGKTVYVDFWFTTCPPCLKQIPFAKELHNYFASDTNVVFLNICVENYQSKAAWKQMIKEKEVPGIHLFYSRNRPQKINVLREYKVTFPTYLILNKDLKVIGYNAPRPSEEIFVKWALTQAKQGFTLLQAYNQMQSRSKEYLEFLSKLEGGNVSLKQQTGTNTRT